MILNSVRAKSAKVCPEAHFPFARPCACVASSHGVALLLFSQASLTRTARRKQPTHIDITLLFPNAPRPSFPSSFLFPLFGIIGLLLCPNFPQGGRGKNVGAWLAAPLCPSLLETSICKM